MDNFDTILSDLRREATTDRAARWLLAMLTLSDWASFTNGGPGVSGTKLDDGSWVVSLHGTFDPLASDPAQRRWLFQTREEAKEFSDALWERIDRSPDALRRDIEERKQKQDAVKAAAETAKATAVVAETAKAEKQRKKAKSLEADLKELAKAVKEKIRGRS